MRASRLDYTLRFDLLAILWLHFIGQIYIGFQALLSSNCNTIISPLRRVTFEKVSAKCRGKYRYDMELNTSYQMTWDVRSSKKTWIDPCQALTSRPNCFEKETGEKGSKESECIMMREMY
uniref:Uncharacterized protein n=1 Tax=Glossina pallidipes TaxID=7398 RepID=A0A1B0A5S6_GLOPL